MIEIKTRWRLKKRICDLFGNQRKYSDQAGLSRTTVSGFVSGRVLPDPTQLAILKTTLGQDIEDFFK